MMKSYDVLIVGAGPAGLSAAKSAAEEGLNVLVIEKSSEIGYPIKSSGGSFIDELTRFNIPKALYHPIRRIKLVASSAQADFEYKKPIFCTLRLREFYQYLAEEASKSGAEIKVNSKALEPIIKNGHISGVKIKYFSKIYTIKSKITIDASGADAIIARKANIHSGFSRFGIGFEFEVYTPKYNQDKAILLLGSKFAPSGYGWIFPTGNNRVRVGCGVIVPDTKENPQKYAYLILQSLKKELNIRKLSILEVHKGIVPSQGLPSKTVGNGIIVVGDSAGHALNLTGEGIRLAMEMGRLAGKAAVHAIQQGDCSEEILMEYERQWRANREKSYKIAYVINKKISSWSDSQWNKYVKLAQRLTPEQFVLILKGEFNIISIAKSLLK